jgi:putative ABC transport system permease protein
VIGLLVREARFRWLSFVLGLVAVTAASGLYVALLTTGRASNQETTRLMRNLGFNLIVVPEGTDMAEFWATGEPQGDMPEQYVRDVAAAPGISADHYVARLQKRIPWRGREALLTGLLPEYPKGGNQAKAPMGHQVKPGTCLLGYELWNAEGIKAGDTVEVADRTFTVETCLLEDGSNEDITIYANLADVQEMLDMPGRINTIDALECLCAGEGIQDVRRQVAEVLPGTHVIERRTVATARVETRVMVGRLSSLVATLALVASVAWVALLSFLNVRERWREIGILRALGFRSHHIATLILGRCALMGLVGAALGFAGGTALATAYGAEIFKLTFSKVKPSYELVVPTLAVTALVAMLAGALPAIVAVAQDPARTLTEE